MFEAYSITKVKEKEIARFISEKIDTAVKLTENLAYLKIILKKKSNLTFNNKSSNFNIDLSSNISMEIKETLSSGQCF